MVADEDCNHKQVGRDSHGYVDALQGQVKENALHLFIAPVKHTEGFHCAVDVRGGVERERGGVEWRRCISLHGSTQVRNPGL